MVNSKEREVPEQIDTNLPDMPELSLSVKHSDSLEDVQKIDLTVANAVLEAVVCSWKSVSTISGVCKLAQMTFAAIESRRKVMGHPYGVSNAATQQKMTVYPID